MKNKTIETQYTREATCPYCGYAETDSWELEFDGMEGEIENTCGKCEKDYIVSRHVEITYCSFVKEAPDGK